MRDRPAWLSDELISRAMAEMPCGRPHLRRRFGLTDYQAGILLEELRRLAPATDDDSPDASAALRCLEYLGERPITYEALADALDRGQSTVRRWLQALRDMGHPVQTDERGVWLDHRPAPSEHTYDHDVDSDITRIGIVSDTHLGSKYQQLTYLREVYDWFADAGVRSVYHAGDLVDGVGVYRGQHGEIFLHSYEEQVKYAVDTYPRRQDMTTYVIGGNHDLAGLRVGGIDPLRVIAARRPDVQHLGSFSAWITIGGLRLYLLHPDGGGSYAVSYRLQKIIESFEGGKKPHILVAGHWHQRAYVDARNVDAFMPGCLQHQTPYEMRKALQPRIGALMLEITRHDEGTYTVTQTWRRYLVPKERDY